MRILICGDRHWKDYDSIYSYIQTLNKDSTIIHGNANGADKLAGHAAASLGILNIEEYPANWIKYGKAAGVIRNQQMLNEGNPNLVVFFHNDLLNSKGTKDMISRSLKSIIPVLNGHTREFITNIKDVVDIFQV